jgi:hypothetical protein
MKTLISFFLILTLVGCSSHSVDSNQLPDNLFLYKDIKNSLLVNHFYFDPKEDYFVYPDSTKSRKFVFLDSLQKLKLLIPVMMTDYGYQKTGGIDSSYIMHLMPARFVSKQSKIGDFTPIIIWVNGDDYGALIYVLLDKALTPISHLVLNGGLCGGPVSETDSLVELCPVKQSFLNGNQISSYVLTEFVRKDSIKRPSIIDSVNYLSTILPSGQIETKQLDSTRYERMPLW